MDGLMDLQVTTLNPCTIDAGERRSTHCGKKIIRRNILKGLQRIIMVLAKLCDKLVKRLLMPTDG
jgi:hypothetical protein